MDLTIKINLDGDAFQGAEPSITRELDKTLEPMAWDVGRGITSGKLIDSNGNSCGTWEVTE